MSTRMCIHACGTELSPRSKLEECPNCRSSFYRWRKRRPEARLQRRENLRLYASRMDNHFDDSGKKKG